MGSERLKLLLVDNDPAIVRLLSKWLVAANYDFRHADDGQTAIEIIGQWNPAFVITDWNMPRMNGLQLCHWVRQQVLPNYIYVVFLTGRGQSEDVVLGLEAGADDFLTKPISKNEMLARLRTGARILALERRLNRQARLDSLTGLATQRSFYESLGRQWQKGTPPQSLLSCAMVDIDFFKRINDTHGHSVGDEVLRRIARTLEDRARPDDVVARYGGEEFCVMLPEMGERQAVCWADQARAAVSQTRIEIGGGSIHVTASFGVAERSEDTRTPEELMDLADQALLVAKQSGRDTVVSFRSINESARLRAIAAGGPGGLFKGLQARHLMRVIVASLKQDERVGRAADFFLRFRISAAPVVDADGHLVGYLSERDVIHIMLWPDCWSYKIRDVMKTDVVCYQEDTPVLEIYEFLCRVSIPTVLIVKNGQPTGMLSRSSLLRWFYNNMAVAEEGETGKNLNSADSLSRGRVENTARALVAEAHQIEESLQSPPDQLVPSVVGGASRMQELLNELLAYSRYLNVTTNRAFAAWLRDGGMAESEPPVGEVTQQRAIAGMLEHGEFPPLGLGAEA